MTDFLKKEIEEVENEISDYENLNMERSLTMSERDFFNQSFGRLQTLKEAQKKHNEFVRKLKNNIPNLEFSISETEDSSFYREIDKLSEEFSK